MYFLLPSSASRLIVALQRAFNIESQVSVCWNQSFQHLECIAHLLKYEDTI